MVLDTFGSKSIIDKGTVGTGVAGPEKNERLMSD